MEIIKSRMRHYSQLKVETDQLEENQTVIVPDTNPDALQVIGVHACLNVQEKNCAQGILRLSGQVNCSICYLSIEGKTPYTVQVTIPFSFSKAVEDLQDNDRMLTDLQLLHAGAVMLNPRKLQVRVQLQAVEKHFKYQHIEYIENIASDRNEDIYCLQEKRKVDVISEIIEKRMVLNDEIRLSSSLPDEQSIILRKTSEWITEDIKLIPGKIMVRGHVDLSLTTMDAQGSFIGKSKYSVPFSQIIECEDISAEDMVDVSYSPVREEIEYFTSADQVNTMLFSLAAVVVCKVIKQREILSTVDAFSTQYEMEIEHSTFFSMTQGDGCQLTVPVRETMMAEEDIAQILGVSVISEHALVSVGAGSVGTTLHAMLIYAENDGTVMTASKKLYVEGIPEADLKENGLCMAVVKEPSAVLGNNGEVQLIFDAQLICHACTGKKLQFLTGCTLVPGKKKEYENRPSLIIKPADMDMSVWEIAKTCNTAPAMIKSANKLSDDETIAKGRLILVPFLEH